MALYSGVALITGAASGIGQATAVSFAREECRKIVIADRNEDGLKATETSIREISKDVEVLLAPTDVSSPASVQSLIDAAIAMFGRIDYICNAAGIMGESQPSDQTSVEEFDRINGINYRGIKRELTPAKSQMLKQEPLPTHDGRPGNRGSIVNIASQLGIVGRSAAAAYCASKSAVISLTRCDAVDYSKDNIRINCVCPGVIETPMTTPRMDFLKPAISIAPMNRPGTPQEVADCVLFLCSSKATFVQGSALVVDGGYVIN
ncbi:NAD(P)-binding protein [Teratosphaeria nubilosa]|uniref:NAD(P)-binding protein n=1 Tax=Teratosphaeria nubilosa TaxID=161662 RepID=A0A6G1LNU4_9PEZI|nr:NAD(P)-binding protein [Teratosphaeria nubilosa]